MYGKILSIALAATLAFSSTADADRLKRIKKESDYVRIIVGKKLVDSAGNWAASHANGTITGVFNKKKLAGKWIWSKKFLCRNATLGGKEIGSNCQVVKASSTQATFTRDQGKGRTTTYAFQ